MPDISLSRHQASPHTDSSFRKSLTSFQVLAHQVSPDGPASSAPLDFASGFLPQLRAAFHLLSCIQSQSINSSQDHYNSSPRLPLFARTIVRAMNIWYRVDTTMGREASGSPTLRRSLRASHIDKRYHMDPMLSDVSSLDTFTKPSRPESCSVAYSANIKFTGDLRYAFLDPGFRLSPYMSVKGSRQRRGTLVIHFPPSTYLLTMSQTNLGWYRVKVHRWNPYVSPTSASLAFQPTNVNLKL